MLEEFLKWWLAQLADLLPARWRTGGQGGNALLVALPENWDAAQPVDEWLFSQRRNGRQTRLGRFALGSEALRRMLSASGRSGAARQIRLAVPAAMLLERQVVLPLAAERELDNVLRYEMDRLTPFSADRLYWTVASQRRDAARARLTLILSMIPRAPLAPVLAALGGAGLTPAALEVASPGATRVIGLAGSGGAGRRPGIPLRLLAGACALLAVVAVALPFLLQARRAAALEARAARLAPFAARAEALRQTLANAASTRDVIAAAAAEVGNPLAVLAAVTAALPDSSYLTELTLNHRQLQIAGQSAAAAALLAALSAEPLLANVTFSASVTRDSQGVDLFSIQTDVSPE